MEKQINIVTEVSEPVEQIAIEPTAEVLGSVPELMMQKYGGADARPGVFHQ